MSTSFISINYDEWKHCITVECGLKLTINFIDERISALQNDNDYHTQQFTRLYGHHHREQVIAWFKLAREMA